jgi:thiamine-phosphate pyrophosphorylase
MMVVTDRTRSVRPLWEQVGMLAQAGAEMVILREKDLGYDERLELAARCLEECETWEVPFSINSDIDVARKLDVCRIHLPMDLLRTSDLGDFSLVGASVHSPEEAAEAESLGADYIVAGHVYRTSCKSSDPRGLQFIRDVCQAVEIPVYGIGGINGSNFKDVIDAGATGVCCMSSAMEAQDPEAFVRGFSLRSAIIHKCITRHRRDAIHP